MQHVCLGMKAYSALGMRNCGSWFLAQLYSNFLWNCCTELGLSLGTNNYKMFLILHHLNLDLNHQQALTDGF